MRRIYLESFIGLLILFTLSIFAYEYIIYELNPDYDYVLQEREGEAFRDMVLTIYQNQGKEAAIDTMERVVEKTAKTLFVVNLSDVPKDVANFFAQDQSNLNIYFDEERHFWFKLLEPNEIYYISPDFQTELRQAIEFDDDIVWGFILGGFFVYSLCLILFLSRRVRLLENATVKFAQGDFNVRAPTKGRDAVGRLNTSFNYMADKISNLIASNRFLTNAVAHDLRTPIFRIQWQAEMLQDQNLSKELHDKIASIIEDTEEMERMVDELLYFAKMERPETELSLEQLNLNHFLPEVVQRLPNSRDINIALDIESNVELCADRSLLKRGVVNLLSNAVKYAKDQVQLSVKESDGHLVLMVEDDGNGIPSEHWSSVFQPFYSADASRNKENSGFGLGLAIVDLIVKRHQGTVEVGQSTLGGAQFTLTFPKL
ncbi:ATP-binding protein [Vibrio tubiashii]|uniref:histidine kinase n=1 Tax=Vibrio tubiashii ATCC 19109 TaxID=1051646 RepID=F9T6K1_9VIBR|nr:ATP-binding protein [Vibrio tubiashii]AIW14165.1 histidine kinase [Vibrio tubiashii ATCC 19109]EGU54544.1 sensory histidine kinase in two-component regulatory system with RstA [Vibrio tubiashii ATCC 19109]EIF02883.1 sensory histidine kinase in two-component regulatory system with RstA [Vibrio tubiashii NCIMB 1337 = ATCC 19106]